MAEVSREEFVAHLRSLDDDGLVDQRFRLYDAAEIEPEGSDVFESVTTALELVAREELQRQVKRVFRNAHRASGLAGHSDAFAEALPVLVRASRELDVPLDAHEVFAGAFEIAERRAAAKGGS